MRNETESERGCGVIHSRNLKLKRAHRERKYQTKPNNLMNTKTLHFGFEENTTLDYEGTTG